MESLIQKHSYARSPIRTYGGEEDVLGDEVQTTQNRGKTASRLRNSWEPGQPEEERKVGDETCSPQGAVCPKVFQESLEEGQLRRRIFVQLIILLQSL